MYSEQEVDTSKEEAQFGYEEEQDFLGMELVLKQQDRAMDLYYKIQELLKAWVVPHNNWPTKDTVMAEKTIYHIHVLLMKTTYDDEDNDTGLDVVDVYYIHEDELKEDVKYGTYQEALVKYKEVSNYKGWQQEDH